MILTYKNKRRASIADYMESDDAIKKLNTREIASRFASNFLEELLFVNRLNELLCAPMVEHDKLKTTKLTTPPLEWLDESKSITILFSNVTGEPICAYFEV